MNPMRWIQKMTIGLVLLVTVTLMAAPGAMALKEPGVKVAKPHPRCLVNGGNCTGSCAVNLGDCSGSCAVNTGTCTGSCLVNVASCSWVEWDPLPRPVESGGALPTLVLP